MARVHVAALVDAELDLAGLRLLHRLGHVERDRAGLRIRHQAARTEHATELTDLPHLVRRGDHDVEVEPAVLDLRRGTPCRRSRRRPPRPPAIFAPDGDHEHAHGLAGAGREDDRAAHDLVGVPRIDAEADGDLDRLVELGERHVLDELDAPARRVRVAPISRLLGRRAVLLAVVRISPSPRRPSSGRHRPPSPWRSRASRVLRSGIFSSAIFLTCAFVIEPTLTCSADPTPSRRPASFLTRTAAGGVFRMKENDLSRVDRDLDREDHIPTLRPSVELFAERHDVDPLGTESRTDRRGRIRLACRNLQLDETGDLLCHSTTSRERPPPGMSGGGRCSHGVRLTPSWYPARATAGSAPTLPPRAAPQ